jgi:GH35 family endo-1,4-beta-xylanase
MLKVPHRWVVVAVFLGLLATLKTAVAGQERDGPKIQRDIPSLYQSLAVYFPMGAAIWQDDISGAHSELLTRHFNSITAENAMKWAVIEPSEGHCNFAPAILGAGTNNCQPGFLRTRAASR